VLGHELRGNKIKVTSIFPGGINTSLWNQSNPYLGGDVSELLNPAALVSMINFVVEQNSNVEIKEIKVFPEIEWH